MLGCFQALLPRDERFFELFARHAQTIVAGADALRRMLAGGEAVEHCCPAVIAREREAESPGCSGARRRSRSTAGSACGSSCRPR
jgi:uncharacterized protein Yka (UPF0111/DUF47 family)